MIDLFGSNQEIKVAGKGYKVNPCIAAFGKGPENTKCKICNDTRAIEVLTMGTDTEYIDCPDCSNTHICSYSRSINQAYPRLCTICGKAETLNNTNKKL